MHALENTSDTARVPSQNVSEARALSLQNSISAHANVQRVIVFPNIPQIL
jgi:hypothetical protein